MSVATVRDRYDADAQGYLRWWAPVLQQAMQPVLDGIHWRDALVVVEVGCGTGKVLDDVRRRASNSRVIGVDLSAGMLRRAGRAATLVQADAQRLPLADSTADVVLCGFVLQHVPEPRLAFNEIARVLGLAGQAGLAAWVGADDLWVAERIFLEELDAAGAPAVASTRMGGAATDSAEKLKALADAAGLTVMQQTVAPLDWQPTFDEILGQLTAMRSTGRRFACLNADAAERVMTGVRNRLSALPPNTWVRDEICYLHARKGVVAP